MSVGAPSSVGTALPGSLFAPARSTGSSTRVDDATRQIKLDQQMVDERKAETDRKAQAAAQAVAELKDARAEVAKDQSELNAARAEAKAKAKLDVYT
ncbi:hypothetical protein [Cryptosporangium minutisporangium]|uniref:Uncharacterized protein n=1 Tax=Cryptosporangium minutisporangium TaxID=113569 RepID=A0ABP6SQ70_9ACTN